MEILSKVFIYYQQQHDTKCVTKQVGLLSGNNQYSFLCNSSVIDTRGAFDSGKNTNKNTNKNKHKHVNTNVPVPRNETDECKDYVNELTEFVNNFGGIHMFCIVFKFKGNYKL